MKNRGRSTKGRPQIPGQHVQGEKHGRHKLTAQEVTEIRYRHTTEKITQVDLGAEYGVSGAHICGIVHGRFWSEEASALPTLPS